MSPHDGELASTCQRRRTLSVRMKVRPPSFVNLQGFSREWCRSGFWPMSCRHRRGGHRIGEVDR